MRRVLVDLSAIWHEAPAPLVRATLAAMVVLSAILFFLLGSGCAHTAAGLQREQITYGIATNVVTQIHDLLPYTPPPLNTIGEALLAAVSAGLTAWNASQHRRIKQLEAKTNGSAPTPAHTASA